MEYPKFFHSLDELEGLEQKEKEIQTGDYNDLTKIRKYRFFVPRGTQAKAVFLDDFHFAVWEHRFDYNNDRYNYETCLRDIEGECPLCESGNKPYLAIASTVLTFWQDKDGNFRVTKKLIVAKGDAKDRLLRRQKSLGDIKGKVFIFIRSNSKTSNALGTDIDYEKDVDWEKIRKYCPDNVEFDEWIKPYDYVKIFNPKSVTELKKMLGQEIGIGEGTPQSTPQDIEDSIGDLI